jgi:hypothetical protein
MYIKKPFGYVPEINFNVAQLAGDYTALLDRHTLCPETLPDKDTGQ